MLKNIKCWYETIKDFLQTGCWIRHCYIDTYEPKIIIATENSFRVSENLNHSVGERVYTDGMLITSKCIYCGKELQCWCTKQYYKKYLEN